MRSRPIAFAALLATAVAFGTPAQAQQTVDLTAGPVDYTTWTLFGDATARNETPGNGFTYSLLSLTATGTGGQAGAAFAPTPLALDFNLPFQMHFNWYIPTPPGPDTLRGDGMTFVLTDTPALGGGGSDLGYGGTSSASVAWAIDTFHFEGEAVSPSLQIRAAGQNTPLAFTETGLGDGIRGTTYQWFGELSFAPSGDGDARGMLTASMSNIEIGSFSASTAVDFSALGLAGLPVFYGFTASNGAAIDGHSTSFGAPVPEPQSWALLAAGLAWIGWMARRRAG